MHPRMFEGSVVQRDRWRMGIPTDALTCFERSDTGVFVEDATTTAINRQFELISNHKVIGNDNGSLEIETSESRIFYDAQPFSPEGLYIHMEHTGDKQKSNSRGTTRTLDQIEGSTALDPGLISKYGWTVIGRNYTSLIRKTDQVDGGVHSF